MKTKFDDIKTVAELRTRAERLSDSGYLYLSCGNRYNGIKHLLDTAGDDADLVLVNYTRAGSHTIVRYFKQET
jgi:hypothetical protein